ncbi:MAG: hypothetical protein R2784_04035 [Saprospiraceae bacterium]
MDFKTHFASKSFSSVWIILILFLIYGCGPELKHDWTESYAMESKEPYGLSVCKELLQSYFPGEEFKTVGKKLDVLLEDSLQVSNYVLIGQGFIFNDEEKDILAEYLERGNKVLIISKAIPTDLLDYTGMDGCGVLEAYQHEYVYTFSDTLVDLKFTDSTLNRAADDYHCKFYWNGKLNNRYFWAGLSNNFFCDESRYPYALGTINSDVNFAVLDDEEQLYLHSTPLAFTNFSLLDESGLQYAEGVFSYLEKGPIYWEEQRQVSEEITRAWNNGDAIVSESPLSYVLSQPPLASAWYLLLFMGILFLVFRAKRRQRIIPVLAANENTSLEFIKTIGKLYFQKGNARQVALQKMKYLQAHIRDRYHIKNSDWSPEVLKQIQMKSEVSMDLLEKIQVMHKNISTSQITTEKTLTDFHYLLEQFYASRK